MQFFKNTGGRKIVMAVTGILMVLFIFAHLTGNISVFAEPGSINAYAAKLHSLSLFVWAYRFIIFSALSLHVFFGIQITLENYAAKPEAYEVRRNLRSTFASRTMIWTGLAIAAYLIFHLLHFTFHAVFPVKHIDSSGRPDVFRMLVLSFQSFFISSVYIAAIAAVALHLAHGIQSSFQTLGINNERTFPVITKSGMLAAIIIFLGYIAIPVFVLAGVLRFL
ncbi:MAG: succinate dehydrogenase cytochrome b subunit [Nitrospirae bacterium]|nr:succinate dehydrogenase cytochrome b subunit [Nitrospirota bacterium]MBI4838507.1 succinate dehydrogenase cytochrome b subunit [Nitrospirota bacterium]